MRGKPKESAGLAAAMRGVARVSIAVLLGAGFPGAARAAMSADVFVSVTVGDPLQDETDSDADGIPDYWEYQYFQNLTTASPGGDYDRDGFLDHEEYLAGTVPTNPSSLLEIDTLSILANGLVVLKWASSTSAQPRWRSYDVYFADSVEELTAGGTPAQLDIPSEGDFTQFALWLDESSRRYFRIKLHQ